MNKRGHVVNAVCLGIGVTAILEQAVSLQALVTMLEVTPPIVLGALFPDLDTTFGTHRKTFHNIWVLGIGVTFPFLFDNLYFVWIGITTHYVLDLLGNVKGMGIFYPLPGFYDIPVGVNVHSKWADVVTMIVTVLEIVLLAGIAVLGHRGQFSGPDLSGIITHLV